MDLVKVNDILEELAELVRRDRVPERLYLEICGQMRRQYTSDNGPESDADEDPEEPSDQRQLVEPVRENFTHVHDFEREHTLWRNRILPAAPAPVPESRPAYSQRDRHVWSRREQAHLDYQSRALDVHTQQLRQSRSATAFWRAWGRTC